jgi:dTDP-4-dehydrorhamnose reductase
MPEPARRIFVAGERGQMAQAIGRECLSRGHVARLAGHLTADIADPVAATAAVANFRPDLIINAAAYTAVDKAEDEAEQAFRVNHDGARHLAEAAAAARAPLVHISTDYVYDGSKPTPYVESDAPHPIGVYGLSKLAGEAAVVGATDDYVILRTSWVCGPDGTNFLKNMLRLAGERDEICVVDDQWGAPTFAADLAKAIVSIGEILLTANDRTKSIGTYHATGSGEATWCGFARAIMKGSAERGGPSCHVRAITSREYPTKAKRPANSRLDCSKLARTFGVRLPPWEVSLDNCLDQLIVSQSRV